MVSSIIKSDGRNRSGAIYEANRAFWRGKGQHVDQTEASALKEEKGENMGSIVRSAIDQSLQWISQEMGSYLLDDEWPQLESVSASL